MRSPRVNSPIKYEENSELRKIPQTLQKSAMSNTRKSRDAHLHLNQKYQMDSYALKSLKDLKSRYVADILSTIGVNSTLHINTTNANPNESKKSATFIKEDSDTNSVIENDCDNDYSDMFNSIYR
jgi:hypothetical protein